MIENEEAYSIFNQVSIARDGFNGVLDFSVLLSIMNLKEISKEEQLRIFDKISILESELIKNRDNKPKTKSHDEIKKNFKNKSNIKL
jgi:hypothetical protein